MKIYIVNELIRQPIKWEKKYKIHIWYEVHSKSIKSKVNREKRLTTRTKKWTKNLNRPFFKKDKQKLEMMLDIVN